MLYVSKIIVKDKEFYFLDEALDVLMVDGLTLYVTDSETDKVIVHNLKDRMKLVSLMKSGVEGISQKDNVLSTYVITKRVLMLRQCLELMDAMAYLPSFIVLTNETFFDRISWVIPEFLNISQNNIYCFEALENYRDVNTVFSGDRDSYTPESLIYNYMQCGMNYDFNDNIDLVVQLTKQRDLSRLLEVGTDIQSFLYIVNSRIIEYQYGQQLFDEEGCANIVLSGMCHFRLYKDALFQYLGCPLFIHGDDLWLGYSATGDTSGFYAMHYRIKDMGKFMQLITKNNLLHKRINMDSTIMKVDKSIWRL